MTIGPGAFGYSYPFTFSLDYGKKTETTIGGKTFKSIYDEEYRTYFYISDDGADYKVTIDQPAWLRVTETGSHRVVDKQGNAYYIPPGFTHIKWKNSPGTERVNF